MLYCIDKGICNRRYEASTRLKAISPVFEEDVFDAISMETCVSTRCTVGAPSKTSMDKGNCRLRRVYEVKLAGMKCSFCAYFIKTGDKIINLI